MNIFFILGFILIVVIIGLIVTLKRNSIPPKPVVTNAAAPVAHGHTESLFPAIDGTEKGKHDHTAFEAVQVADSELVSKYVKAKQDVNKEPEKAEKKEEMKEVKANEVVFNLAHGTLLSEVLKRKV